jgi:hypothetical protein
MLPTETAQAHRLRPAMAVLDLSSPESLGLHLTLNAEALLAGIGPEHRDTSLAPQASEYASLRALPGEMLRDRIHAARADISQGVTLTFDGKPTTLSLRDINVPEVADSAAERLSTLTFTGHFPADARRLSWHYAALLGASALRVVGVPGVTSTLWLNPGEPSGDIVLDMNGASDSRLQVAARYMVLGFTHIVPGGLDHVLFVLGIFLLSLRLRPLLYQVTAFTIAHSITLCLALFDVVSLPASVVEPLIAASIVYVAVENLLTDALKPWRVYVVFAFGLLHGLGFAGVLTELGLARGEFITALAGFNVGVELGQLAVIAAAFLAVGLWFRHRAWYRQWVAIPASSAIAISGGWWTVSRLL